MSHPSLNPRSYEHNSTASSSFAGLAGSEVYGGRLPGDVGVNHPNTCLPATPNTPTRVLEDDVNWSDWLQDSPVKGAGRDGTRDTSLQDARLDYPSTPPPQATSEVFEEVEEVEFSKQPAESPFQEVGNDEDHPNSSIFAPTSSNHCRTPIEDPIEPHPYACAHTATQAVVPSLPPTPATPPSVPQFNYFSDEMVAARHIGAMFDGFNIPSRYVLPGMNVHPLPPGFASWEAYHANLRGFLVQSRFGRLRAAFEDGCWNDFLDEISKNFPGEGGVRILRRAMQMAQVFGLPPESFILDTAETFLSHFAPELQIRSNPLDDLVFGRMIQAVWCIIHPNQHLLFGPAHVCFFKPLIEDLGARWPTGILVQTANIVDFPSVKL
ncbi:hypothetical protein ONZ45_g4014 [Pleurotus djamor]|nr:hypothetical protein ONZ45_g4014 [Pleurotus djamor]